MVGALSSERDRLLFECRAKSQGRYDGDAHLRFVRKIQGQLAQERFRSGQPQRPLWIVLDNYSVHHSKRVRGQEKRLSAQGIHFFFLPAYCPEMNEIEPLWRQVKYQDLPDRSHETEQGLYAAVEGALRARADAMRNNTTIQESP